MNKEIRQNCFGTEERPRLVVFRSNRGIYAQVINDAAGKTIASVNISEAKEEKTPVLRARLAGKLLAEKAKKAKISEVIFDRNGYRYHGQVKSLAEGAREAGLKF